MQTKTNHTKSDGAEVTYRTEKALQAACKWMQILNDLLIYF